MNQRQVDEAYDTDKVRLKCKNGPEFARAMASPLLQTFCTIQAAEKRPGKLTFKNILKSSRLLKPSKPYRPPISISTSNKNSDLSSANDDIWPTKRKTRAEIFIPEFALYNM